MKLRYCKDWLSRSHLKFRGRTCRKDYEYKLYRKYYLNLPRVDLLRLHWIIRCNETKSIPDFCSNRKKQRSGLSKAEYWNDVCIARFPKRNDSTPNDCSARTRPNTSSYISALQSANDHRLQRTAKRMRAHDAQSLHTQTKYEKSQQRGARP